MSHAVTMLALAVYVGSNIGLPLDLPETLEQAAGRIRDLKVIGKVLAGNLRDEWNEFRTRLEGFRGREFLGLRSGLAKLDEHTLGLRGLMLLGAMPNVGKTALVLHLGVIDYLQVIPIPDTVRRVSELDADKYQVRVVQDVLAGMQQAESNLLGDAVIAISETRKPATGKKHWGEDLADLMGSARLGYGADAVLLYRRATDDDELTRVYDDPNRVSMTYGQLEQAGISPIMLSLAKGRDGIRLVEWLVEYHFNRSIFREVVSGSGRQLPSGKRPPAAPTKQISVDPPATDLGSFD